MTDPDRPVIIGVAQRTWPHDDLPGPEPLAAWELVCRAAAADAGLPDDALAEIDTLALVHCRSWDYDAPLSRLSDRLGAAPRHAITKGASGASAQVLLEAAAARIRAGEAKFALVCGGESLASERYYRKQGEPAPWSFRKPGDAPRENALAVQHPQEFAAGIATSGKAVYSFALREIAWRAHRGLSPERHRQEMGELLAGLSAVAAANPDAWFRTALTAQEIVTPRPQNTMFAFPYTKRMMAVMEVDISAAVILTSESHADALGIPRERRVYFWNACYAEDPIPVAVRSDLWRSPAMAAAGKEVLSASGLTIDDVRHFDLYSCFAVSVEFACDALGIGHLPGERTTVTGGLPFAGGPASSYVLTSIVKMVERLRSSPGDFGMISALGMLMSRHMFALYSTNPPPPGLRRADLARIQEELDAIPQRAIAIGYEGPGEIASYTVVHDRVGEISHGIVICDLPDGSRAYGHLNDKDVLRQAEAEEFVGVKVMVRAGADENATHIVEVC